MFGRKKRSSRRLRFESLSERIVLSANAVSAGEGETDDPIVVQQGNVVFVLGTAEDNHIEVDVGIETHRITIDGSSHEYSADAVRHIVVSGQGGNDEANIHGTPGDDRVNVDAEEVEMLGFKYDVRVRNTKIVRLFGDQGFDTARILDSPGDDQVYMHSTFTGYSNSEGEIMKVSGFERVNAVAERGGNDQVSFYDSEDDDLFVAREGFAYLAGDHFTNHAKGFDRIDAYHRNGGDDEARLFGSDGNDSLHATPDQLVFQVGNTKQVSHSFPRTRAYGQEGQDSAQFHGTVDMHDAFGWRPGFAFMTSYGSQTVANSAEGFEVVEAFSGDDDDVAKITGSDQDDVLVGLPDITQLTTPEDGIVVVNDFSLVSTYAEGGDDFAHLEDSVENDRFTSKADFAFFRGPGFVNHVIGFEKIDAVSRTGGGDFGHAQEYAGPDQDYLVHDGGQFLIYGPGRSERFIDFEAARGDADNAGWRIFNHATSPFTLGGVHDASPSGNPNEVDTELIVQRLGEPVAEYEVLDGRIVEKMS